MVLDFFLTSWKGLGWDKLKALVWIKLGLTMWSSLAVKTLPDGQH